MKQKRMTINTRDMSNRFRGLPKILKINEVDSKNLRLSVLFSNSEHRILDFKKILKDQWQVEPSDPEHILLDPKEFKKVKLSNNTLSWDNVMTYMTKLENGTQDIELDTLFKIVEGGLGKRLKISVE